MPVWAWIAVAAAAVVLAVALAVVRWRVRVRRRTQLLRGHFGPEYDVAVGSHGSRREGEEELARRLRRRDQLPVHPLDPAARERYLESWQDAQAQFVDVPEAAVAQAHALVRSVMTDRGYPAEDLDQRVADISVDHPVSVDNYRLAQAIAADAARGEASTEELRQAMHHYRQLFDELVEANDNAPSQRLATATATEMRTDD
jgi:C4-dicarboxylate-specific signal transduction histidine kinase